jgi:hypothetical protein
MSEHRATVEWQRSGEFRYETYSRAHTEKCYIANSVKTVVVIEPC